MNIHIRWNIRKYCHQSDGLRFVITTKDTQNIQRARSEGVHPDEHAHSGHEPTDFDSSRGLWGFAKFAGTNPTAALQTAVCGQ